MKSDLISKLSGKKVEVKIKNATISTEKEDDDMEEKKDCMQEMDEWRVKDDFQTLVRAEEIKSDGSRMKLVKALAKKQGDLISKI